MDKDKKRILIGAGIIGGSILVARLMKRVPPPPPPPEGYGLLQGYIVNKNTGAKIPKGSAQITIDGTQSFYNIIDELGGYRTPNLLYGIHHFKVEANNYVMGEFDLEISKPVAKYNFELEPLPSGPPGEWSEGVEVQKIFAEPQTAYLGEVVTLNVYIQYGIHDPNAYPTPATIFGTVKVNGQEIREEFDIDFRNPTLQFQYSASQIGGFTAVAQGKSCHFMITEKKMDVYSPFGGERMPVCTAIVIPNLPPFQYFDWGGGYAAPGWVDYPGGDLQLNGQGFFDIPMLSDLPPKGISLDELLEYVDNAYPIEWDTGTVTSWKLYRYKPMDSYYEKIMAYPVEYECPPYWNDSDELIAMIVSAPQTLPDEFILDYGDICPVCGGTGIVPGHYGRPTGCMNCGGLRTKKGLGRIAPNIYISSGLKNWIKPINIKLESRVGCWITCPYCGGEIMYAYPWPYSSCDVWELARKLLAHIETNHPDHPLTEPAWF